MKLKSVILLILATFLAIDLYAANNVALCINYRGKICVKGSQFCFCRKERVFCKKAGIEGFCVKGYWGCDC